MLKTPFVGVKNLQLDKIILKNAVDNIYFIWGPWSFSSWIYNYLCNQCLLALNLYVRIALTARCTRYNVVM